MNWVWIESGLCWIESELNLSIVKCQWIESELNPGLHCQESWAKQIKFTSSEILSSHLFLLFFEIAHGCTALIGFPSNDWSIIKFRDLSLAVKYHNNPMKSHEINYCYWPTVIQSIFDWSFTLNEDFAKGKHMADQTNNAAVLLVL